MGKRQKLQISLGMANRRSKRSKIWDSRGIVQHIWGTYYKVILRLHVRFFRKYDFQKAAYSLL